MPGGSLLPVADDSLHVLAREALELGVRYLGLCCGAAPHHVRAMAEALGRTPPASRYSEDMSRHIYFGTEAGVAAHNRGYRDRL